MSVRMEGHTYRQVRGGRRSGRREQRGEKQRRTAARIGRRENEEGRGKERTSINNCG